jgi:hypothetical protein
VEGSGFRAAIAAWKEAAMSKVDMERAFHLMTLPPPTGKPHEWPAPIPIAPDEQVAVPVEEEEPCDELAQLGDEEKDAQIREVAEFLAATLEHPQRLSLVLDLIACTFDVPPGCAERLFWIAHEHGYVSLREGIVHLDRTPAHH